MKIFEDIGAYWEHDNNPKRPHVVLTSGKHSSGFFNGSIVVQDVRLSLAAASDLVCLLQMKQVHTPSIGRVIGSAHGATFLASDMSQTLRCGLRGFTETVDDAMKLKRFPVNAGERVLAVEDVITSGETTAETITEIEAAGASVLPFVAVLVNRSGKDTLKAAGKEFTILSLVTRHLPIWPPEECPLCKAGSEAFRPKGKEIWARLRAQY